MKRYYLWLYIEIALGFWVWLGINRSYAGEPAFNALSLADPHYLEYQAALCAGTREEVSKLDADKYWLDMIDPKLGAKSPQQRVDWVINYVITSKLRDDWRKRYEANCAEINAAHGKGL